MNRPKLATVAVGALISLSLAAPSMAQSPTPQSSTSKNQSMSKKSTMSSDSRGSTAAQPLREQQTTDLLNQLSAQGYQPRGAFQKVGNTWQMPATNPTGQSTTVVLDPGTGQVSAQQAGGGSVQITSMPTSSRSGSMSGAPDNRMRKQTK